MILTRRSPTWTVCVLTIPQREPYLRRLFESLRSLRLRRSRWELSLVYNWDTGEEPYDVERRLRKLGKARRAGSVLIADVEGRHITIFPDGRALIRGVTNETEARSVYAKYVGI